MTLIANRGPLRLWRARRRRDRIDAVLVRLGSGWELRFVWNDTPLIARRYARAHTARAEAASRLKDLERSGWVTHW